MKNTSLILIAIVLILVLGGGQTMRGLDLSALTSWFEGPDGVDDGKVNVEKRLTVVLMDKYAGAIIASKTVGMYDSDGFTPLETVFSPE